MAAVGRSARPGADPAAAGHSAWLCTSTGMTRTVVVADLG